MDIEAETRQIQQFMERGNYHAAYNIALSALNACHKDENQEGVDHFIDVIRGIVERLAAEFGSRER